MITSKAIPGAVCCCVVGPWSIVARLPPVKAHGTYVLLPLKDGVASCLSMQAAFEESAGVPVFMVLQEWQYHSLI